MNGPKPRPGYGVSEKSVNYIRLGGGLVRNDRALRAGGIDRFFVCHNTDIVRLISLSLLLRVLVGIVFEVAVITIMPYCPLMS